MTETWTYCVPEHGETLESDGRDIEVCPIFDDDDEVSAGHIADDEVADHFWGNCGGWEACGPITFRLRSPRGAVFDVSVDMEAVPSFTAGPAKPVEVVS